MGWFRLTIPNPQRPGSPRYADGFGRQVLRSHLCRSFRESWTTSAVRFSIRNKSSGTQSFTPLSKL